MLASFHYINQRTYSTQRVAVLEVHSQNFTRKGYSQMVHSKHGVVTGIWYGPCILQLTVTHLHHPPKRFQSIFSRITIRVILFFLNRINSKQIMCILRTKMKTQNHVQCHENTQVKLHLSFMVKGWIILFILKEGSNAARPS